MDSIRSIIVPVDFSAPSRAATERACMIATSFEVSLHLVHAATVPIPGMSHEFAAPGFEWETIREAARKELDTIASDLEQRGFEITHDVVSHDPVEAIAQAVAERDGSLVVMGSAGHSGIDRVILGSVAERTLRSVDAPVLVVKEDAAEARHSISRIVLATDFSPHAEAAANMAIVFAKRLGARVAICHVQSVPSSAWLAIGVPPPASFVEDLRKQANERMQRVLERFTEAEIDTETHLLSDTASLAIPSLAKELDADLIVMGTRGLSGVRHVLLGSVAERTVRLSSCSVLAVHEGPKS